MRVGKIKISGGALLIISVLYYWDDNGVILWVILASLLHEMGHWWAISRVGGKVNHLRLSCMGAELQLSAVKPLTPRQMVFVAIAGPMINLILALTSAYCARHGLGGRLYFFAGINFGLACFNLLPISWLDGGKILQNGLCCLGFENLGEVLTDISSKVILTLFLLGGGALLWQSEGRNFTVLIAGIWMLIATRRQEE